MKKHVNCQLEITRSPASKRPEAGSIVSSGFRPRVNPLDVGFKWVCLAVATRTRRVGAFAGLILTLACAGSGQTVASPPTATNSVAESRYEHRADHDPAGIGKFYMGREIARVVGHQAAEWLERATRVEEEGAALLVSSLKLKPGDVVADIGCGTGYYTRRLAKTVGPSGLIYAEDIQLEMLAVLTNKLAAENIRNVRPILGTITDPNLPAASVDLILLVDVYHEFDHSYEMMTAMIPALKPGGRIAFVEFRGEDSKLAIKKLHRMTEAQLKKEIAVHPLMWIETVTNLPQQHLILFRRN